MISAEWVGYVAACLTTISFLPQIVQVWKTRETHAISLRMYLLFAGGVSLWLYYGVLVSSWPIVIANGITLFLSSVVIVLKLRHG